MWGGGRRLAERASRATIDRSARSRSRLAVGLASSLGAGAIMACRWGTETSVGRCHELWMNFANCVTTADDPGACQAKREDYVECLHSNRQIHRINTMYAERKRRIEAGLPVPTSVEDDIASGKLPARLEL